MNLISDRFSYLAAVLAQAGRHATWFSNCDWDIKLAKLSNSIILCF